jgi:hypothetical protein
LAQSAVRNRFAGFSSGWKSLTQAQRNAWNNAVSDYKSTDIFGDIKVPSGINLYQRLNNVLAACSIAPMLMPPLPSAVDALSSLTLVVDNSSSSVTATYAPVIAADHSVMVFATAPLSAGRNFVKSQYRLIDVIVAADVSPVALSAAYIAKFGNVGSVGQKVFVKFVPVNNLTGQQGSAIAASSIVVA